MSGKRSKKLRREAVALWGRTMSKGMGARESSIVFNLFFRRYKKAYHDGTLLPNQGAKKTNE